MALALYYYLAPVARLYLRHPAGETTLPGDFGYGAAALLCAAGILLLGLFPQGPLTLLAGVSQLLH